MEWLIGLLGGVFGGNAAGAVAKENGLGTRANSVAGGVGGAAAGGIIQGLMHTGIDFGAVVSQLVGGGASGAIVTAVVIMIRGGNGETSNWRPE